LARYVRDDLDGVGFVFTLDDPYCGIDLDKCVNPASGAINDQAREIVDALQSYTELSPSGTGLHIIVRATLSAKGRKRDAIEIYDRGRYFTVTGQPFEQPLRPICDQQGEVDRLYATLRPATRSTRRKSKSRLLVGPELPDSTVIDCILASTHGRTFSVLYGGNAASRHSSHSEADLALTGILATYIGNNPKQIDRIFRGSALFREKWDEQRGELTYGEMTIAKALGEGE
jgi:primase-polymerase (primpol)-like protein